jgi:ADP-ribose pyrophosphatase YjhB (NUDIX family)
MRYCPQCTQPLIMREEGGRERLACPDTSCGFVHFGNFSIGCGGVVMRDGRALLVQRGWEPFAGAWQIPGGYVEHDEPVTIAVEREVLEEAGITARARDAIAFRHSIGGSIGGPSTNIYIVFRLDYIDGEPNADAPRWPLTCATPPGWSRTRRCSTASTRRPRATPSSSPRSCG